MNIAFDGKRFFNNSSGLGVYSRTLFKALKDYYPENTYKLFVHQKYLKGNQFQESWLEGNIESSNALVASLWRTFEMGNVVDKSDYDVFHGLSNELPQSGLSNVKKVVTIHDLIAYKHPEWFGNVDAKILKAKVQHAVDKADKIIVPSKYVMHDIDRFFNKAMPKTKLVYEAIAFDETITSKNPFSSEPIFDQDYFLFVGNYNKRKNLDTILDVLSKSPDYNLVALVGNDKANANQQKILNQLIKKNRLLILTFVEASQLKYLYQHAKALIYPSLEEGFGLPILEAIQNNCAVITSEQSAMVEVAGPGAIYIDPMNPEAMSSAMDKMGQTAIVEELRILGREHIKQFSTKKMALETLKVYKS